MEEELKKAEKRAEKRTLKATARAVSLATRLSPKSQRKKDKLLNNTAQLKVGETTCSVVLLCDVWVVSLRLKLFLK